MNERCSLDGTELPPIEVRGLTGVPFLDFGGALAERVSLFGRFSAHSMPDPRFQIQQISIPTDGVSIAWISLGAGLGVHLRHRIALTQP